MSDVSYNTVVDACSILAAGTYKGTIVMDNATIADSDGYKSVAEACAALSGGTYNGTIAPQS